MTELSKQLKNRLEALSDDALFEMIEKKSGEYTPDALAMINAEVAKRGGVDALKESVERAEKAQPANEDISTLKKFFFVTIIAACGLFIFALNGSYWFYWICLFAMIASMFAVLFRPKYNPEDEIKELLGKVPADPDVKTAGFDGGEMH